MDFSTALWNNWLIPKLYTATGPEALVPIERLFDKEGERITLQVRDAKMLATLLGARFMTTTQLAAAFWQNNSGPFKKQHPEDVCLRRLTILWKYGLLARIRPRAKSRKGSLPWIWALTSRGFQVLERSGLPLYEERLMKGTKFDESSLTMPSQLTMRHAVLVSEFGTRCLAEGGEWYFEHEAAASLDVPILNTKSRFYYPDAVLEWPKADEEKEVWLLELERSANQKRFREKMAVWRSLLLLTKAEDNLGKKFVVMAGRIKDTLPDRDERSLLPLAKILVQDGNLLDFVKFIGIPDDTKDLYEIEPLDARGFLTKYSSE